MNIRYYFAGRTWDYFYITVKIKIWNNVLKKLINFVQKLHFIVKSSYEVHKLKNNYVTIFPRYSSHILKLYLHLYVFVKRVPKINCISHWHLYKAHQKMLYFKFLLDLFYSATHSTLTIYIFSKELSSLACLWNVMIWIC